MEVRDQFILRFGKERGVAAMENLNNEVNERVFLFLFFVLSLKIVHKLKIQTPDQMLVNRYLKAIADSFKVNWSYEKPPIEEETKVVEQNETIIEDIITPLVNPMVNLDEVKPVVSTGDLIGTINSNPVLEKGKSNVDEFDDLARRFEALKKR